ncbi:MAG: bifunctional adenosylcobinamide kinase/adenosylcobinamide-phosphate guanylyltransferase [Eggerthellaceae bacterium]|nr:bifunctional adenosylcobinamide kinase/adenosylcobinamide-phosphate guanylyltransferase [Eggerthellaceae bacterium]
MMVLVTGGASSGKSAFAERVALSLPGPHAYVATMRHGDSETEARIARHRAMREGKGFETIELGDGAESPNSLSRAATKCRRSGSEDCLSERSERVPQLLRRNEERLARAWLFGDSAPSPIPGTALLEDLGNLVANGLEDRLDDILAFDNVVIVANEVGCDGVRYDDYTMEYVRNMGSLACGLAARSDVMVEVVAGVPSVVKGELQWMC